MDFLSEDSIKENNSDSLTTFKRGLKIYEQGTVSSIIEDFVKGFFTFEVDGNYGDYLIEIELKKNGVDTFCDCPYPSSGCKHLVAALLFLRDIISENEKDTEAIQEILSEKEQDIYLTEEDIKIQALVDRKKRAKSEPFTIHQGDTFKGEHFLENRTGKKYSVILHDPEREAGHCSCPDYLTNRLNTCKHLIHLTAHLKNSRGYSERIEKEIFPFIDVFWNSEHKKPETFYSNKILKEEDDLIPFCKLFQENGILIEDDFSRVMPLFKHAMTDKRVRVQSEVIRQFDHDYMENQLRNLSGQPLPSFDRIRTTLYPYQKEGVKFAVFREASLIGDEMGLGKTLQAIATSMIKKDIFGFSKVLIITVASLKEQWKREIKKFTNEEAVIISGSAVERQRCYQTDPSFFKITNYEAILRDILTVQQFNPDIVVLDEAQRIKNFKTKTADAVKSIPKKHAMVLTGTPLENKLEDIYSIIQFLDSGLLSPLWKFAGKHFMMSRDNKGKIMGYRNLRELHEKLKSIVIRRKKEDVLKDLPRETINNYYIDLTKEQAEIHSGYGRILVQTLNKKFLTPMDMRKIQILLLKMRQVCDSTFLIDRETNISPKLRELEGILDEIVVQNGRKAVIFSEWTTMTFLIAKHLSHANIPFVELSGKIPVHKRQALIDEFTNNPECKVFLSTDAGGTGLNLQAADCVINFELPWNPAKMNQRIGRVNRIGQTSKCINVVNLITKLSIEEKILTSIQMKTDLFKGVFDGESDTVEFSHEKRNQMLNQLREIMGEEPELPVIEQAPGIDIPEETPHFLNPEVFGKEEDLFLYDKEETSEETLISADAEELAGDREHKTGQSTSTFSNQSPEHIEHILNSGMEFLGGLMEMATGQKMKKSEGEGKMINLDKETGEVTMKFKLPGF